MRHGSISIVASLFIALLVTPATAAIRHVNAATGADATACVSAAAPCKTVTYAMGQATGGAPGDEIQVAAGRYDGTLGETFPIVIKSGVRMRSTAGPESTFLDAGGQNATRVLVLLDANADTLVEGFTITGGVAYHSPIDPSSVTGGGGMIINGGSPTIRKNVFLDNRVFGAFGITGGDGSEGRGGGVYVTAATPAIVNNVFRGNVAFGGDGGSNPHYFGNGGTGNGGAIYFEGPGGTIANNTFYRNAAVGGVGGSSLDQGGNGGNANFGALYADGATVNNNIFAGNAATGGRAGGSPGHAGAASIGAMQANNPATPASNNLFLGNTVNGAPSTGDTIGTASVCTGTPPCPGVFFHGEPSNLRITPQSPASGTGTSIGAPVDDFDGAPRPNPPSIGAFEPSAAIDPVRLANISTRAQVLAGDDVMIGGLVITGSTPKTVVVRARGPSLASSGLGGLLANPMLQLFSGQTAIAANDDWQQAANAAQIQASGFAPSEPTESAILVTLEPGAYTAIVSGGGSTTGIGIVEVFEVDAVTTQLVNISTRGRVQTGNDVMIAGFIIQGTGPQSVVVRARGPSLAPFGIAGFLANPTLQLFSGQTAIASNDDWQGAANAAQIQASGFAPSDPAESAILITLQPGAYTAIVSGAGGGTGTAIVEVFKN